MSEPEAEGKGRTGPEQKKRVGAGEFTAEREPRKISPDEVAATASDDLDSLWEATDASDIDVSDIPDDLDPVEPTADQAAPPTNAISARKTSDKGQPAASKTSGAPPSGASSDGSSNRQDDLLRTMSVEAMTALLEAAETAQKMVDTSDDIAERMHGQRAGLELAAAKAVRMNWITLGSTAGILLIAIMVFLFMSAGLSTRVSAVDQMLTAVTERVVKMNAALDDLQGIDERLSGIGRDQSALTAANEALRDQLTQSLQGLEANLAETRDRLESIVEVEEPASAEAQAEVMARIDSLEVRLGALQESIDSLLTGMSEEETEGDGLAASLAAMESRLERLDKRSAALARLERDLQALVTLTRERMLEALPTRAARSAAEKAEAESRMLRYPLSSSPDTPDNAPVLGGPR